MKIARITAAWLLIMLGGCAQPSSQQTAQLEVHRAKYLLAEEPEEARGILEFREQEPDASEVVLFGRVGGLTETWSPGAAAFVMCDPSSAVAADQGHVCKDGCAFCKKTKQDGLESTAIVQFTDASGKVLPIDARQLFALEEKQTVVVRGTANVDSLGNLVVSANGIYIRR